jgi:hypothetical protein
MPVLVIVAFESFWSPPPKISYLPDSRFRYIIPLTILCMASSYFIFKIKGIHQPDAPDASSSTPRPCRNYIGVEYVGCSWSFYPGDGSILFLESARLCRKFGGLSVPIYTLLSRIPVIG